jgi:SAM-dependent methyltransferase
MYSLGMYGEMVGDAVRMRAYTRALRDAVKPHSVVLDIGTGTGIFAILAAQFGARRVYAIEPAEAIRVARDIAAASGCADRIEFIQQMSTRVSLPERADVIISDLHGALPLYRYHLPSIIDARERLLAPGGTLIPLREHLRAAVVESPVAYERATRPWGDNAQGLDMEPARRLLIHQMSRARVEPEGILLPAQTWAALDYTRITDADVSGKASWIAEKSGTAHGVLVWFDAVLAENAEFTNAPGEPETIYGSTFFPLAQPVTLDVGDRVEVTLSADLVNGEYVWRWNTVVAEQQNGFRIKATFKQSTFFGTPLSRAHLCRTASGFVPTLDEDGEVDRFILVQMDGANSLDAIARQLMERYPARFANNREALNRAGLLSNTYSRR